jgi:hypothetical protein
MAFQEVKSGDFPETWKPKKEGDQLVGTVTRKETVNTQNGESDVLEIEDKVLGAVTVFVSAGLKSLNSKCNVGDLVRIVFEGDKVSEKTGRTFHSYASAIDDGTG